MALYLLESAQKNQQKVAAPLKESATTVVEGEKESLIKLIQTENPSSGGPPLSIQPTASQTPGVDPRLNDTGAPLMLHDIEALIQETQPLAVGSR
jgi:hypothetical protein